MKKRKPIILSEIKPEEKKKYEIAKELGLLDKVLSEIVGKEKGITNGKI